MHVSSFSDVALWRYILFQLHVRFVNAITWCLSAIHHALIICRFPLQQTLLYWELNVVSCSLYRTRVIVVQSDHAASWFKRRHFVFWLGDCRFESRQGHRIFYVLRGFSQSLQANTGNVLQWATTTSTLFTMNNLTRYLSRYWATDNLVKETTT